MLLTTSEFDQRKKSAIEAITNACELDKSPKGSVDEPIKDLVELINSQTDFATTSSCSGRISVFHYSGTIQKGSGKWILALHGPLQTETQLEESISEYFKQYQDDNTQPSVTLFKHEPFVLHVMCRSSQHAQDILKLAIEAGFRESGISFGNKKIMLGVRTTSNVIESPIGKNGKLMCSVEYLRFLTQEANHRFNENSKRIRHFYDLLLTHFKGNNKGMEQVKIIKNTTTTNQYEMNILPIKQMRRWGNTCTKYNDSILIFGGIGPEIETCIYENENFRQVDEPMTISRSYHTCVHLNGNLYIFGGRTSPTSPTNEMLKFSSETESFDLVPEASNIPSRWKHTAIGNNVDTMYIYGGRGENNQVLADLWEFNVEEKKSILLTGSGKSPGPLFSHTMMYSNNEIFIHGGLPSLSHSSGEDDIFIFCLETKLWSKVLLFPEIAWRFSHSWILSPSTGKSYLVGGISKNYSKTCLTGQEIIEFDLENKKVTNRLHCNNSNLLAVQNGFVILNHDEQDLFFSIGGGATCFAFGSVFSFNAVLKPINCVKNDKKVVQEDDEKELLMFVKCEKTNAVQVREYLLEAKALDKKRKVETYDNVILFPVYFEIESKINNLFLETRANDLYIDDICEFVQKQKEQKTMKKMVINDEKARSKIIQDLFNDEFMKVERIDDVLVLRTRNHGVNIESITSQQWKMLLNAYPGAKRVVLGNEVDSGPMRKSRNRLIYDVNFMEMTRNLDCWVTVVENGIKFAYDITRCMYSKGNVSEKLRFGKLIQPNEIVLDLFAGIGYFTVPALVHTNHVQLLHACEWNPDAVQALRKNLALNNVDPSRYVIHPGDCRQLKIIGKKPNRISLGLLPDSKVGYDVAVRSLSNFGGWLHVHGNALETELEKWGESVVEDISLLFQDTKKENWKVICRNIQKVKSYAPRVLHLVADIECRPENMTIVEIPSNNNEPPIKELLVFKRKTLTPELEQVSTSLRRSADELLCSPSPTQDSMRMAANAELLFRRVSNEIKRRASFQDVL